MEKVSQGAPEASTEATSSGQSPTLKTLDDGRPIGTKVVPRIQAVPKVRIRTPRRVIGNNYDDVRVAGIETISGQKIICLEHLVIYAYIKEKDTLKPIPEIKAIIARFGIHLAGKDGTEILERVIPAIPVYNKIPVLEHPGRTQRYFGLLDGSIINKGEGGRLFTAYPVCASKHLVIGTVGRWRRRIGTRLEGDEVAQFCAMLPLAAILAEVFTTRC